MMRGFRHTTKFLFVKDKSFSGGKKVVRKAWPLKDDTYLIDGQLGQDTTGTQPIVCNCFFSGKRFLFGLF